MKYGIIASDYDGTLAHHGAVPDGTVHALTRLKESGMKIILVSGRELPDLRRVCRCIELFDALILENGALLYLPHTGEERLLCQPANLTLADKLKEKGVLPLSTGKAVIAGWQPHLNTCIETITELGLDYVVNLNKDALMLLPSGIDKASGLTAALTEFSASFDSVIGFGDAENDVPFLSLCGYSVAVGNALPAVKTAVDHVTSSSHGDGVAEFIINNFEVITTGTGTLPRD